MSARQTRTRLWVHKLWDIYKKCSGIKCVDSTHDCVYGETSIELHCAIDERKPSISTRAPHNFQHIVASNVWVFSKEAPRDPLPLRPNARLDALSMCSFPIACWRLPNRSSNRNKQQSERGNRRFTSQQLKLRCQSHNRCNSQNRGRSLPSSGGRLQGASTKDLCCDHR